MKNPLKKKSNMTTSKVVQPTPVTEDTFIPVTINGVRYDTADSLPKKLKKTADELGKARKEQIEYAEVHHGQVKDNE